VTTLDAPIEVDALSSAVEQAVALGAAVADVQPQGDVRVLLDPALSALGADR
jgi:hypothetical protein